MKISSIMVVPYTENGNCYVLTNFAAANNPIFRSEEDVENFKGRLNKHLSALCEIMGYSFHVDQFQIIVSLKERAVFEAFYIKKMLKKGIDDFVIPESTYILSQEMANIESGYAKWFNFKYGRYGVVFGRRYTKDLINDEVELEEWVEKVNKHKVYWSFEEMWSYIKNFVERLEYLRKIAVSSRDLYGDKTLVDKHLSNFIRFRDFLLRGSYKAKYADHQNWNFSSG